jgi:hypothetical protein
MSLKVVAQFPGSNENCIKQFMHFQLSCLGVMEDFTDEVHQTLNSPDPPWGVQYIHLHRIGLQRHVTLGTQKCFQELGLGGFPITGTCHAFRRLGTNLGFRCCCCLQFMGPDCIPFSWHLC